MLKMCHLVEIEKYIWQKQISKVFNQNYIGLVFYANERRN